MTNPMRISTRPNATASTCAQRLASSLAAGVNTARTQPSNMSGAPNIHKMMGAMVAFHTLGAFVRGVDAVAWGSAIGGGSGFTDEGSLRGTLKKV